ncbi:hypothetical protein ZHAS_00008187 [Anopheles sinensis]|uniref:Uncharacterized protein n=1 Tax=Anopheles sinensis TaxID=74873 RepID=A0A084VS15_ANOSI|nr:hypothetical protein ZHAS_00008187 [Anopheles sinensis]
MQQSADPARRLLRDVTTSCLEQRLPEASIYHAPERKVLATGGLEGAKLTPGRFTRTIGHNGPGLTPTEWFQNSLLAHVAPVVVRSVLLFPGEHLVRVSSWFSWRVPKDNFQSLH